MDEEDKPLEGLRVAILASDMVEESELVEPRLALEEAGAETVLIAPHGGEIVTANHYDKAESYPVDMTLNAADPTDFDALLLPGGALNADLMRADPKVKEFIRDSDTTGKPIAAICHAPWELISAGVAEGRHMTGYYMIADDVTNAEAEWSDEETVLDGNLLTSRQPDDIPAFNRQMIDLFAQVRHADELAM